MNANKLNAQAQQREAQALQRRDQAFNELRSELRELGYDFTAEAGTDWIVFISRDFSNTDHRVDFLAALRRRRGKACGAGFKNVRLASAGFSDTYSLDCSWEDNNCSWEDKLRWWACVNHVLQ